MTTSTTPPSPVQVLRDAFYHTHGHPKNAQIAQKALDALTTAGYVVIRTPNTATEQRVIDDLTTCISDALSWAPLGSDAAVDLMDRRDTARFLPGPEAIAALRSVLTDALPFAPADIRAHLTQRAHQALHSGDE